MVTAQENRQILILDDDMQEAETVSAVLETAGFTPVTVTPNVSAPEQINYAQPDLLLIDITDPRINGLEVLRQTRAQSTLPIIALSDGQPRTHIAAFDAGADDVVCKPIPREELVARIHALLRRIERMPPADDRIIVRQLELYLTRRMVLMRGQRLHLTPIEYNILITLMRNAGKIVSHEEMLHAVWGNAYDGDYSVLRVNISRLRQKLEENPRNPSYIITIPGEGYIMHAAP
jgi:DNA-binding response OmpR family regulator